MSRMLVGVFVVEITKTNRERTNTAAAFGETRFSVAIILKNIFFLLIYYAVMQNFEYLCASKSLYTYDL